MISKVTSNSPEFQARLKVKRNIPKELSRLLENTETVLPDKYFIKVKNNWILNSITNDGEPVKKGNFDVSVYKKSGVFKKENLDIKSYNWIVYKQKEGNNFLETALQIYEDLYNLKDKLLKKSSNF